MKKYWAVVLVAMICIASYFLSKKISDEKLVQKEIEYTSKTASEVFMVWGINYLQMPPKKFWPGDSYEKDGLVYTRLLNNHGKFVSKIVLPNNTLLNYWMVQKKDEKGNETDIWDSGGTDKEYYSVTFSVKGNFNPGYFIFLAGFLPLLMIYIINRKKQTATYDQDFKTKEYIPQFDAIRAIAVLLVILHHWLSKKSIVHAINFGPVGVNVFFVLSGFLITAILLRSKKQADAKLIGRSLVFKNFYLRRTLRIFPIYYLVLFVFCIIGDPEMMRNGIYYFTYTSNYLFYSQQFFSANLAHLWSLAVEEQFYIIWPWLIILVNRNFLPYLIGLFLVVGIASNFIVTGEKYWTSIFTTTCFDAFALGGFLAYLVAYRQDIIERLQPIYNYIFFIALILFLTSFYRYSFLPARTSHAVLAVTVLYYCLFKNNNKIANYILNNKLLIQLGKISYGVYLYHLFVPQLWLWIIKIFASYKIDLFFNAAMSEPLKSVWLFLQEFSFLILMCIISWKFIEKPVNGLKKKFEYKPIQQEQQIELQENSIAVLAGGPQT